MKNTKELSIRELVTYLNTADQKGLWYENSMLRFNPKTLNFVVDTEKESIRVGNAINKGNAINGLIAYMVSHKKYTAESLKNDLSFNQ